MAVIGVMYYAGLTNIWTQGYLPVEGAPADAPARRVVDTSYNDYRTVSALLTNIDQGLLHASSLYQLYQHAVGMGALVMTTEAVYQTRQAREETG